MESQPDLLKEMSQAIKMLAEVLEGIKRIELALANPAKRTVPLPELFKNTSTSNV